MTALTSVSSPLLYDDAVSAEIQDIAVSGDILVYTTSGYNYSSPYGLGLVRLNTSTHDGNGITKLPGQFFSSTLPLGSPTFIGDLLYVRHNQGLATFDMKAVWGNQVNPGNPVYLGSQGIAEAIVPYHYDRMLISGPWAHVLGT